MNASSTANATRADLGNTPGSSNGCIKATYKIKMRWVYIWGSQVAASSSSQNASSPRVDVRSLAATPLASVFSQVQRDVFTDSCASLKKGLGVSGNREKHIGGGGRQMMPPQSERSGVGETASAPTQTEREKNAQNSGRQWIDYVCKRPRTTGRTSIQHPNLHSKRQYLSRHRLNSSGNRQGGLLYSDEKKKSTPKHKSTRCPKPPPPPLFPTYSSP